MRFVAAGACGFRARRRGLAAWIAAAWARLARAVIMARGIRVVIFMFTMMVVMASITTGAGRWAAARARRWAGCVATARAGRLVARFAMLAVSIMAFMTIPLLITVATLPAFPTIILYERMRFLARFLLADNGQMCVATVRNIYSTSWSLGTSAQHKTASMVFITIPIVDPALTIRSGALISDSSGVEEIVNVYLCQMHSQGLTNGLSLASRNWCVDYNEISAFSMANIQNVLVILMVMMMVAILGMAAAAATATTATTTAAAAAATATAAVMRTSLRVNANTTHSRSIRRI